jgi:hypothetical protein
MPTVVVKTVDNELELTEAISVRMASLLDACMVRSRSAPTGLDHSLSLTPNGAVSIGAGSKHTRPRQGIECALRRIPEWPRESVAPSLAQLA